MTTELDAPLMSWITPILGYWPYDKKVLHRKAHCSQHVVPEQSSFPDVAWSQTFWRIWSVSQAWL